MTRRGQEKKRIAKIHEREKWCRCKRHVEDLFETTEQGCSTDEAFDRVVRKLSNKDLDIIAGSDVYFDDRFKKRAESELMLRKLGIEEKG